MTRSIVCDLCSIFGFDYQVTLQVLDCFFLHGPKFLLKTALALLKLNQSNLLAEQDSASIVCYLKEKISHNTSNLLQVH
jgi:hypothetical protein